jgi:hypothetical protein
LTSPDDERPFPTSRCHGCTFVRYNGNKRGSIFLACSEPSLPRYQPQPVVRCDRRVAAAPEPSP